MFDKDITIINKWFNKVTKINEYKINHVHGFWSSSDGIAISNTSLVKDDGLKVLILLSEKGYQTNKEFQTNPIGWTLKNDDYLVKGFVDRVTTIADLKDNYECMKITSFSIKDYGSLDMQHFEISGE